MVEQILHNHPLLDKCRSAARPGLLANFKTIDRLTKIIREAGRSTVQQMSSLVVHEHNRAKCCRIVRLNALSDELQNLGKGFSGSERLQDPTSITLLRLLLSAFSNVPGQ